MLRTSYMVLNMNMNKLGNRCSIGLVMQS